MGQDNKITLPSFIPSPHLYLVSQIHHLLLFLSDTLSHSFLSFFFKSRDRNCSLQNEIAKWLQMTRYLTKWKGWKGNKQTAGIWKKEKIKIKDCQVENSLLQLRENVHKHSSPLLSHWWVYSNKCININFGLLQHFYIYTYLFTLAI